MITTSYDPDAPPDIRAQLMDGFTAQHIVFTVRAREAIQFSEQPGMNIRGALYEALIRRFSPNNPIPGLPYDPIRQFLEGLDENNPRGQNIPRAYTIQPPPPGATYQTGEQFEFGMALFGEAQMYIPYLFYALRDVASGGIGRGRGRFEMLRISEVNPITRSRRQIMDPHTVSDLRLALTHPSVLYAVNVWRGNEILLRFLTPTRLTSGGGVVRQPTLGVVMRRLLERAQSLVEQTRPPDVVAGQKPLWKAEWERLGAIADAADRAPVLYDDTKWIDISSFSRVKGLASPIGGFMGKTRWRVEDRDVLYWLLWGQSLHIGKNTAKGDGWYRVE